MITLTPNLTSGVPNPNVSFNNSWIPVGNDGSRPFFAQATYDVTTESTLGQSGFVFLTGGQTALGQFSTIQVLSACKISALSANNSSIGSLYNFELPANFVLNGPITGITLAYGAVIVYKL
jgi:hypothetical protein